MILSVILSIFNSVLYHNQIGKITNNIKYRNGCEN